MDQGISIFKITKADATYDGKNLTVNLHYPRNPEERTTRLPGNSAFGAKALDELLRTGSAEIATPESPIKPADGGSMYAFSDGVILVHRRMFPRGKNKVHNYYHGAPGGYTEELGATFSENGLLQTGDKETAEEQLIVARGRKKYQVIREGSKEYALAAAKNAEIYLRQLSVSMSTIESGDTLNVYWEDGEPLFTSKRKGWLDFMWDNSTSLTLMQVISVPFPSTKVYPIDAEGTTAPDGNFIHFNRESYLIPISEVANKQFGTPLKNFEVFQTRIDEKGIPHVYTPKYAEPFYGPDEKAVTHPHLWAPENHTTVCLDALGVPGFAGKRLDIQLWKERCALSGESMIPEEFLVK
ncbi:MAG: hypothetical protein AABW47_04750 [Nanoarchaeota archaeon]